MQRSVSILQQGSLLLTSLPPDLTDSEIVAMQTDILDRVIRSDAKGVILDVGAVDVLDSFSTRTLSDIATAVRLRGARMAVAGIQPEVAISMVLLGLTLPDTIKALDLNMAVALLSEAAEIQ